MQAQIIQIPDLGGVANVEVIEILVQPGDHVALNAPLLTLESDKASMEIPSPMAGQVQEILVKLGDKVSQGTSVVSMIPEAVDTGSLPVSEPEVSSQPPETAQSPTASSASVSQTPESSPETIRASQQDDFYAGPAVRRLARELGVDLSSLQGSGRKSRIVREDVIQAFKQSSPSTVGVVSAYAPLDIDFSQFGSIETKPLHKIKRITAQAMHRSWVSVPHVTQFDEVDITELEAFRQTEQKRLEKSGTKLTLLPLIVKALIKALRLHPQFNASLSADGQSLIYKNYYHIGIAVDTPNGLVVPVIKNADQLTVTELALKMQNLSATAREKGLMPQDMTGGSFTVSSLGGIGGTYFTPIVNAPEVAILGVSRAQIKPVYDGTQFNPRLMLPLSLSYDHRVIDGAEAARFMRDLNQLIHDIRRILI